MSFHSVDAFYQQLPVVESFTQVFDRSHYRRVPPEWSLVITDVVNSTTAIEEGRYKDVNTAGSIAAMAITNLAGNMEFPFLFGGDGMTYVVPPSILEATADIVADTRTLVRDAFDLELRCAAIPLEDLYAEGHDLWVARLRVSESYVQAVLDGSAIQFADRWIRDPKRFSRYRVAADRPYRHRADFTGFTCRWKDIPSSRGETISLIVRVDEPSAQRQRTILKRILREIEGIFGSEADYQPITEDTQRLATDEQEMSREVRVNSRRNSGFLYRLGLLSIRMQIFFVRILLRFQIPLTVLNKRLRDVKRDNIINSDFRKFDGTLKMVLSGNRGQREALVALLDGLREDHRVYYGIHVSDRALLTCLIHSKSGNEVHFVDSADGGYATAASELKRQLSADQRAD